MLDSGHLILDTRHCRPERPKVGRGFWLLDSGFVLGTRNLELGTLNLEP